MDNATLEKEALENSPRSKTTKTLKKKIGVII